MKQSKWFCIICVLTVFLHSNPLYPGTKWEEIFDDPTVPPGWKIVNNDAGGDRLRLFSTRTLAGGTTVLPQIGQYFWSGSYMNANLSGVIDEWLISPQVSVIYHGDSLFFWAGAIDNTFNDSLRVWVSTTDQNLSSFTHLLGSFKVDGPAGSWHRYGFDLSPFDSSDIYFAINYYIRDGGSGGQNSDGVWIDHCLISGDPQTINQPPTSFHLKYPTDGVFLHPLADTTIEFSWNRSFDLDNDSLYYQLEILDIFPTYAFAGISDTMFAFDWHGMLNFYQPYRWTVSVTDGKSTLFSPDTFFFITPPAENLAPYNFSLLFPANGTVFSPLDTIQFNWERPIDPNSDTLDYTLHLFGNMIDTTFPGIIDTTFMLAENGILQAGKTYQWSVAAADSQYITNSSNTWRFSLNQAMSIEDDPVIAGWPILWQNYPNPFNGETVIRFQLPVASVVTLEIYDVIGRHIVEAYHDTPLHAGAHKYVWNATDATGKPVSSGLYYYQIISPQYRKVKKLLYIK